MKLRFGSPRWLTLCIALAAGVAIGGSYLPEDWRSVVFVAKPLATILILVLAAVISGQTASRYRWGVIVGLGFSLFGDIYLMLPGDYFVQGLISFLLAHVAYLVAFTQDCRRALKSNLASLPYVAYSIIGILILSNLWRNVPTGLRVPVVVYLVLLVSMASQSVVRLFCIQSRPALWAAIGGGLFLASDSLLAINKFGGRFRHSGLLVLGTYFTAQMLIALSAGSAKGATQKSALPSELS